MFGKRPCSLQARRNFLGEGGGGGEDKVPNATSPPHQPMDRRPELASTILEHYSPEHLWRHYHMSSCRIRPHSPRVCPPRANLGRCWQHLGRSPPHLIKSVWAELGDVWPNLAPESRAVVLTKSAHPFGRHRGLGPTLAPPSAQSLANIGRCVCGQLWADSGPTLGQSLADIGQRLPNFGQTYGRIRPELGKHRAHFG